MSGIMGMKPHMDRRHLACIMDRRHLACTMDRRHPACIMDRISPQAANSAKVMIK
jgi:hypothetical protein